jgi:hypothetical protein
MALLNICLLIDSSFPYLCKNNIMQALKQIVDIKDHTLNIVLPDDFKADKVEVIVLSIDEPKIQPKIKNSERFAGSISKETAEKLHKHLSEVRNEWE